jgi:hypothetical protein
MTNATEISTDRILKLQHEAAQAGDRLTVNDCCTVLHGADDEISETRVNGAMSRIASALADAEAQQ